MATPTRQDRIKQLAEGRYGGLRERTLTMLRYASGGERTFEGRPIPGWILDIAREVGARVAAQSQTEAKALVAEADAKERKAAEADAEEKRAELADEEKREADARSKAAKLRAEIAGAHEGGVAAAVLEPPAVEIVPNDGLGGRVVSFSPEPTPEHEEPKGLAAKAAAAVKRAVKGKKKAKR